MSESQKTDSLIERASVQELEGVPKFYANNVELRLSPWDFRITFGEVLDATEDGLIIERKVIVSMSPQHTKAVLDLLERNVKRYEEEFGEINSIAIDSSTEPKQPF